LDGYVDAGLIATVALVNDLVVDPDDDPAAVVERVLAVDPPSLDVLTRSDIPAFVALAGRLHEVFTALDDADVDRAAAVLNALLAEHLSHPHLAKEDGVWRLHHHPVDAPLVPMWTAICADALARRLGTGQGHRLGTCSDPGCGRAYVDVSKNASRRFCSTTCQNRVKAAAHRARRRATA
jgi:predicted RNA-binding Zn ribbon-like protein